MSRRALVPLAVLCAAIALGQIALRALGVDSPADGLRDIVARFGWWSPAVYVVLLTLRHFVFLPSSLALTIGGGVFGVLVGSVAGAIGLLLGGLLDFWLFRVIKPKRLVREMEARAAPASNLAERGAPLVVFASTAIPPAPMTFFYWAASLTSIGFGKFAALIAPSGAIRAVLLSLLGAGLIESDWRLLTLALGALAAGLVLALQSPRLRAALLPPAPPGASA